MPYLWGACLGSINGRHRCLSLVRCRQLPLLRCPTFLSLERTHGVAQGQSHGERLMSEPWQTPEAIAKKVWRVARYILLFSFTIMAAIEWITNGYSDRVFLYGLANLVISLDLDRHVH